MSLEVYDFWDSELDSEQEFPDRTIRTTTGENPKVSLGRFHTKIFEGFLNILLEKFPKDFLGQHTTPLPSIVRKLSIWENS